MFCNCKADIDLLKDRIAHLEKAHGKLLDCLIESNRKQLENSKRFF